MANDNATQIPNREKFYNDTRPHHWHAIWTRVNLWTCELTVEHRRRRSRNQINDFHLSNHFFIFRCWLMAVAVCACRLIALQLWFVSIVDCIDAKSNIHCGHTILAFDAFVQMKIVIGSDSRVKIQTKKKILFIAVAPVILLFVWFRLALLQHQRQQSTETDEGKHCRRQWTYSAVCGFIDSIANANFCSRRWWKMEETAAPRQSNSIKLMENEIEYTNTPLHTEWSLQMGFYQWQKCTFSLRQLTNVVSLQFSQAAKPLHRHLALLVVRQLYR